MASPISIGPDANRTGLALKFRWRTTTYTFFIGLAVRTHRTFLVLPQTQLVHREESTPGTPQVPKGLFRDGESPPPPPPPPEPPPEEPTGVTPPADGPGTGPPRSSSQTEEKTYRLEIGFSSSSETTEGVTPPADTDKKKPPT